MLIHTNSRVVCPPTRYSNRSSSSNDSAPLNVTAIHCIPCTVCEEGEETVQPCTSVSDTVCRTTYIDIRACSNIYGRTCSPDQYLHYNANLGGINCTNCSLHNREQVSESMFIRPGCHLWQLQEVLLSLNCQLQWPGSL